MVPSSEVVYSSGPSGTIHRLNSEAGVGDGWDRSALSTLMRWMPGRRSLKKTSSLDAVPSF